MKQGRWKDPAPCRDTQAGLTMIELLVSATLFVGGLLALAQVSMVVSDVHRIDETRMAVAQTVAEQLHEVENTVFHEILPTHQGRGFTVRRPGAEADLLKVVPGDADGLPGRITIEPLVELDNGIHLVRVTARVDWQGRSGPETFERQSLISRYGVNE